MTGVGIDLLEIDRMQAALDRRPRLAERLFTPGEREAAAARARPAQHLAARFCAKEAVVKALKLESWDPHEIEVVGGGDGPPAIRVSGKVEALITQRGLTVEVSLTHSRDTAGAVALALPAAATGAAC
ncbi:MAG: holo-ACP synthase [Actinomycetota bacterium]|nr:holo-ACP synthase [Actinomycetota bacterium]